jgi:uroporphyrinogen decarboxylase
MTGRERIKAILSGEATDRPGFWHGNPSDEAKEIYCRHFGIRETRKEMPEAFLRNSQVKTNKTGQADIDLAVAVGSDMIWLSPELDASTWRHPDGRPMWDFYGGKERLSLTQAGVFAECEDASEVDDFEWPDPAYLDFSSTLRDVDAANSAGLAVFGGMWMPFFHIAADFFGMENYFMKMYTHPEVVLAVTERIVEFYIEANRRCLDLMAGKLVAGFFGNDFGSQLDLLISPEMFGRFILPFYVRCIAVIKSHGLKAVVHSCGAIDRIIPTLIEAGIDGLHPLQAKAAGMDAENLARKYKGKLVFIGGVDTQELLPFGTEAELRAEVRRLRRTFGEGFILSPSHEALLPNVSPGKLVAMAEEALVGGTKLR